MRFVDSKRGFQLPGFSGGFGGGFLGDFFGGSSGGLARSAHERGNGSHVNLAGDYTTVPAKADVAIH